MTQPRLPEYLGHILAAAREILEFVDGHSRATFLADRRTQQAVVMNLLIIGEAPAQIMDRYPAFTDGHPEVPWRDMRGMRNRMAHGYFETNYEIVWATACVEIPRLVGLLSQLPAETPDNRSE